MAILFDYSQLLQTFQISFNRAAAVEHRSQALFPSPDNAFSLRSFAFFDSLLEWSTAEREGLEQLCRLGQTRDRTGPDREVKKGNALLQN